MARARCRPAVLGVLLLTICGCGNEGPSTSIEIVTPGTTDNQTGTVGQPLANDLSVLVMQSGIQAEGVTVTFTPAAGSGSVVSHGPTAINGIATGTWTLGTGAGPQSVTATTSGADTLTFNATALAGPATFFSAASGKNGDNQSGQVNTDLPDPLRVVVLDAYGNPVSGKAVTWAITEPGTGTTLTLSGPTTGANGEVSAAVHLGTGVGQVIVNATATLLGTVAFTLTATP